MKVLIAIKQLPYTFKQAPVLLAEKILELNSILDGDVSKVEVELFGQPNRGFIFKFEED